MKFYLLCGHSLSSPRSYLNSSSAPALESEVLKKIDHVSWIGIILLKNIDHVLVRISLKISFQRILKE